MAHFIQDPSIARAIDDLKRRWPAIGAAADHPLTEWFIRRESIKQKPEWSRYSSFLLRILAYVCLFNIIFWTLPRYLHGIAYILAPIIGAIERRIIVRRKQRNVRNLRHLLTREGDAGQIEQLWLTPITYRDCAGIHLGYVYNSIFNPRFSVVRKIVFWLFILGLVWVFNKIISSSSASVPNIVAAWFCLAVLCFSVCRSLSTPAYILDSALQQIRVERLRFPAVFDENVLEARNSVIVAFILFALMIGIFLHLVPSAGWFVLDLFIMFLSLLIFVWVRILRTRDFDRKFTDFVETESIDYDELVSRLLHRDKTDE